jgi:DNA-nicking Smr family endonuclease
MRKARVSEEDHNAWALYLRSVKNLPGRTTVEATVVTQNEAAPAALISPTAAKQPCRPLAYLSIGEQPSGVDKSSWSRFRSGKIPVVRKLDLHSSSAEQAYYKLRSFLAGAYADRVRAVEVITGRGSGPEGGVLRRELPIWLNLPDLRPMILGAAHPHAANPGSVILLLRRPK